MLLVLYKGAIMSGFKKIGEKIKFYRDEKGISIEMLAKNSSISVEKLKSIEKGEIVYNFSTLFKIAHAMEIDLPELLDF